MGQVSETRRHVYLMLTASAPVRLVGFIHEPSHPPEMLPLKPLFTQLKAAVLCQTQYTDKNLAVKDIK